MKKLILMFALVTFVLSCISKSATKNIVVKQPVGLMGVVIADETAVVVGNSRFLSKCLAVDIWNYVNSDIEYYKTNPQGIKVCCSPAKNTFPFNVFGLSFNDPNKINEIVGCITLEEYLPLYELRKQFLKDRYCKDE